jgi:hypothetical protein
MSKPVPIHVGSPRPSSPASALLSASECPTASLTAMPVHGVSTTRATTPGPSHDRPFSGRTDIMQSWHGSCECYALSPVAGTCHWRMLLLSVAVTGTGSTVTRVCALCGGPSLCGHGVRHGHGDDSRRDVYRGLRRLCRHRHEPVNMPFGRDARDVQGGDEGADDTGRTHRRAGRRSPRSPGPHR